MRTFLGVVLAGTLLSVSVPARGFIWPSESARIERELESSDVAVRRRAARQLRELPQKAAERAVVKALSDEDLEVRLLAVQAAKDLRLASLSEQMLGWLTEADPRLRLAAAEMLGREPSPRTVGPLSRALSDVEPQVRAAAATALGTSGAPEAVIGLLGRLDDSALEVKESVIRALARLGDVRAVVPLVSKIEDPRPAVRRAVARALGELGDRRAVSALVLALRDPDPTVRAHVLEALGELGDPTAAPSISAMLPDEPVAAVRVSAVGALGRLATPEAVARLVEALGTLPDEREALVRALSRVGPAAVPALTACLRSSDSRARADGCALALAYAKAPEGGAAILEAVRRGHLGVEAALLALAELGERRGIPLALEYLSQRDPAVRRAALTAASALLDPSREDGRAVEPLELAFQAANGRRGERVQLLELLGRTGSPRAARVLVPIADGAQDLEYRLAALSALAFVRDRSALPALLRALSDPEPSVRLAAALSIRKTAPAGIATELVERLERAGAQDRTVLALALPGALASAPERTVLRVVALARRAQGGERDALIEALSHTRERAARQALAAFSESVDAADRAKVAEGLARDASSSRRLVELARDADSAVRANAIWSLGSVAGVNERALLVSALGDRDVMVAANAAAALARASLRLGSPQGRELCEALGDRRAAVRASALGALRLLRARCEGKERALLAGEPSARVRQAAAELVRDVSSDAADSRALRRCSARETVGSVAAACSALRNEPAVGNAEALVFVVPAGESEPVERAPFALRRPDGLVHHGRADRRGAVCESNLGAGELSLDVPAALED